MKIQNILYSLALQATLGSASVITKRAAETNATLYA
jgi:hypothetical protein